MKCFEFDLNYTLQVTLLSKEKLIPPRLHRSRYSPEYILYFILEGELFLEENGKELKLSEGDIYIFKKGEFHKPLKSTFCKYYYIHFDTDHVKEYDVTYQEYFNMVKEKNVSFMKCDKYSSAIYNFAKVFLIQKNKIESKGFENYCINLFENNIISQTYQNIEKRMDISHNISKFLLTLETVYTEHREKKNIGSIKGYNTVKKIISYLEKNYKSDICSNDIEKEFFMNFDYLNRIFKKFMGCNIMKYKNILRINEAKAEMLVSDKSLSEISTEAGFKDNCYFCRVFKKFEGITPGEYRNQPLGQNKE